MFDYSLWELLLILLVALLVIGPKQLPAVANKLGLWLRYLRNIAMALRHDWHTQQSSQTNPTPDHKRTDKIDE